MGTAGRRQVEEPGGTRGRAESATLRALPYLELPNAITILYDSVSPTPPEPGLISSYSTEYFTDHKILFLSPAPTCDRRIRKNTSFSEALDYFPGSIITSPRPP